MDLNEITANLATILTFSGTVYVSLAHKYYRRSTLLLLWFMTVTSLTWGRIPLWINDIMYDMTFIFILIYLIYDQKTFGKITASTERKKYIAQIKKKFKKIIDRT